MWIVKQEVLCRGNVSWTLKQLCREERVLLGNGTRAELESRGQNPVSSLKSRPGKSATLKELRWCFLLRCQVHMVMLLEWSVCFVWGPRSVS